MAATQQQPQHLTEIEVEQLYGIPRRTLQMWRLKRRVLPFLKLGKLVRYRAEDLRAYAQKNLVAVDAK